jgi:universal stress protein A
MLRPTKILVPTDYSRRADKALKQAMDIAQEYGAKVYLLHVAPGVLRSVADDYADISITGDTLQDYEKTIVASARKKIERQVARLLGHRTVEVIPDVVVGKPEEEIIGFQREKHIDLVVTCFGRSRLSGFLIGSVARTVLRGAKCPVLLSK